ncbi:MAG: VCBS repeat-containing protein [Gimesia sp.]
MNIKHAYYRRFSFLSVTTLLILLAGSIQLSAGEKWQRQQLDAAFRSEGSAAADVNKDGKMDVIAGDVWYEAPDWKMHEVRKPGKFVAGKGYSDSFCNFAYDINQDGWTDFIYVSFPGKEFYWYENPKNKSGHWKEHLIWHSICNETPKFADLNGDGKPELIFGSQPEQQMGYLEIPSPELATKKWDFIPISKPGDPKKNGTFKYYHGLGVGDFNRDGRQDVLIPNGWWEGPKVLGEGLWEFHPFTLSVNGTEPSEKMADLYVEDLDQDGDNDIIGSSAHEFGIWWFENVSEAGKPKFKAHLIDKSYSQTHAMHFIDMNGDGQRDMVTGKRFFAHNGSDPGGKDPVVMYWYEIKRSKNNAPKIIPHKIDAGNDTGVGTQFSMADMNGDGRPDIILSNKKGVNVLIQK